MYPRRSRSVIALIAAAGLALVAALAGSTLSAPSATAAGGVTWTWVGKEANPTPERQQIFDQIAHAMDEAVAVYNANSNLTKALRVSYDPAVPTAQGNINGSVQFGSQWSTRTALHEIAHTLGIGTDARWSGRLVDGVWTGATATALVKQWDGPDAVIHGDRMHFWPYGLNQDSELATTTPQRHVQMVAALIADMTAG